jgi:hypothetical protein
MAKKLAYPFVPKSNAYLRPGHYWQIPLSNGKFACGRVLQVGDFLEYGSRTTILAGLMDWSGDHLPTSQAISGCKLLEQGGMHIKGITWNGGQILGLRSLESDNLEPMYELSQTPGKGCMLMRGLIVVRDATLDEMQTLDRHSGWGYGVIKGLAEMYFVQKRKPVRKLPRDEYQELLAYIKSR